MRVLAAATLLAVALTGCRCSEPSSKRETLSTAEVQQLLTEKGGNTDCQAFQIVDGPDGKKRLECVDVVRPDAGR